MLSLKRKKSIRPKVADVWKTECDGGIHVSGLVNFGNSCYANSILQALRFCPGFSSAIASLRGDLSSTEESGSEESSLIVHLHQLLLSLSEKNQTKAIMPVDFMASLKEENPMFAGSLQQDAHEMLRFLLIKLLEGSPSVNSHREVQCGTTEVVTGGKRKRPPSESTSGCKAFKAAGGVRRLANRRLTEFFSSNGASCQDNLAVHPKSPEAVSSIFVGELLYQTQCFECDTCTRQRETFLDITVPVSSSVLTRSSTDESMATVGPFSLSWALTQFAAHEQLRGENKYWCDNCGHLAEAKRSIMFSRLPRVLTVHLNRFTTRPCGLPSVSISKVNGNIATPLTLSLRPWSSWDCPLRDQIYELFAVIFHSGSSCLSGHYTTYVRANECCAVLESKSHEWILFDDDIVQKVPQATLLSLLSPLANSSMTAYILFYKAMLSTCL